MCSRVRAAQPRLIDLFEGRGQLIVYHFMFDPSWEAGCPSCSFLTDNIGHLAHLRARKATLVLVSRAPLPKIEACRKRMGWTIPRGRRGRALAVHHPAGQRSVVGWLYRIA